MLISLFTDASYYHQTRSGGWAAWAKSERGVLRKSGTIKGHPVHSSHAECCAVVNGIHCVVRSPIFERGDAILVQTDCQDAIRLFEGKRPPRHDWEALIMKAFRDLRQKAAIERVIMRHVKGHRSSTKAPRYAVNNWCDEAAGRHAGLLNLERMGAPHA